MPDQKITELTANTTPLSTDLTVIVDDPSGTPATQKITIGDLLRTSIDGWLNPNETWEYVSVDDPTGVFRVNADVTGKYSAGMRIKFTNATNVIYGIITAVGAYTGGYTSITFLHQIDPTDSLALYLMANSAITANYYSTQKSPFGFPLEETKWTVLFSSITNTEAILTQSTWTNKVGSLSVPIGSWKLSYSLIACYAYKNGTSINFSVTLANVNNNENDQTFTVDLSNEGPTSATMSVSGSPYRENIVNLTSKITYYTNFATTLTGVSCANGRRTIIKAICSYL